MGMGKTRKPFVTGGPGPRAHDGHAPLARMAARRHDAGRALGRGLCGVAPFAAIQAAGVTMPLGVEVTVTIARTLLVVVLSLGALWLMARYLQRVRLRDIGVLWSGHSLRLLGLGLAVSVAITVPAGLVREQLGALRP